MKLKSYISEIKNRMILLTISFVICTLISYYYKETLLFLTIKNLKLENENGSLYFISTNITEIVTAYFKISYINSGLFVIILVSYHLLTFFSPALTVYEYIIAKKYVVKSFISFFFLLLIFNNYLLPLFWNFFLHFQDLYSTKTMDVYFEGKIEEYIKFYTGTCFLLFIINQFCVGLFLVLDYIRDKILFIKSSRKVLYLIFLVLSTTITPPDVFSQLSTFIFFLVLFETLVIITLFKYNLVRKPIKA